ncbi:hypothetical protein MMC08_000455 [Hypocenomyce scalaris]|nr:hypothetical protein [Hypocenomyce scalaris]
MAPLPTIDYTQIADLSISSLELDRRSSSVDLPTYLSSLSLSDRESFNPPSLFKRFTPPSSTFSPQEIGTLLRKKDPSSSSSGVDPGAGTIPPEAINNKGILALFALLSVGLVLASIWFFFWAKNGGFVFRKGDWDEYKSTVLRRKGPNGTTLSGATKTTALGGGSIVGSEGSASADGKGEFVRAGEKRGRGKKGKKNGDDDDVRAYRHEKPAKVGGLNREADATYTDYISTDPSDISHDVYNGYNPPPKKGKPPTSAPKPRYPSYTPNSESAFSVASDDSRQPLRPSNPSPTRNYNHNRHSSHSSPVHTPTRSRQSSPTKKHSSTTHSGRPSNYTDPIDFASRYTASDAETEESRGTKAYFHPIPGLSKGGNGADGFRRGGGRRRDSFSDSEGEGLE